jgi:hypothetical protein
MKGRVYMDRIISLLRWSYKSLEIMLKGPGATSEGTNTVADVHSYAGSSSGDDQPSLPSRPSRRKKRHSKPKPLVATTGAGDSVASVHHASSRWEKEAAPDVAAELAGLAQDAARGPRWACPVNGHSNHTLDKCQDFWEAASCTERRNMLANSSCFTCLGRDQGCSNGACAIINEVPLETFCQGCAKG